jgi:hypothetical protein
MRESLYSAAKHFRRGKAMAERGDARGALAAYADALRELHAVRPQRMRDVLLAHVHLSRYELARRLEPASAGSDLRLGYSYARMAKDPAVRELAERLWRQHLEAQVKPELPWPS